jgi:hypothetical protein
MPLGLPVAFLLMAQAAAGAGTSAHPYGPEAAVPPKPAPTSSTGRDCSPQTAGPKGNEIVVCAIKPEGYRLPPDIVEARRLKKQGDTVRPRNPHETYADHSCTTVGPMGCRGTPTINMIAVAAVAAEISKRLAKGQEVGSIFETTPSSSEYQFYLEAKREREAKEARTAAAAAKAKAEAEQARKQAATALPPARTITSQ